MSETTPNPTPKKKRNLLVDLLCVMLVAAIVLAVVGFVGKDNAVRANTDLDAQLTEAKAAFAEGEEKLTASAVELEAANTTISELEAAKAELETASAELEARVAEFEKAQTALEEEKAGLETAKTTLEGEKAELEASNATLADEKAALEAAKAEVDSKLTALQSEFSTYKTTAETKIKSLETQASDLTQKLEDATKVEPPAATPKPALP